MIGATQLAAGATPHLLQAALLPAAAQLTQPSTGEADGHAHACRLLCILHSRLASAPAVQVELVPALLRALVPVAPRSFHGVKWYDDCIRQLQSYQEATAQADERMENRRRQAELAAQEPTRAKLKVELEALERFALDNNAYKLLEHVYRKYEPKCEMYTKNANTIKTRIKDADADTLKKVLRDAMTHYHPDKNKKHGIEWQVRCEEVYKHLNGKYDRVKQG